MVLVGQLGPGRPAVSTAAPADARTPLQRRRRPPTGQDHLYRHWTVGRRV